VLEHAAQEDRPVSEAPRRRPLAGVARTGKASFDWRSFVPILPFFYGFDDDESTSFGRSAGARAFARSLDLRPGAAAQACYLVLRGAAELLTQKDNRERRIGSPARRVDRLSCALGGAMHSHECAVRERAALLEFHAKFSSAIQRQLGCFGQPATRRSTAAFCGRWRARTRSFRADQRRALSAGPARRRTRNDAARQLWTVVPPSSPAAAA
jgi:hypothetical protein